MRQGGEYLGHVHLGQCHFDQHRVSGTGEAVRGRSELARCSGARCPHRLAAHGGGSSAQFHRGMLWQRWCGPWKARLMVYRSLLMTTIGAHSSRCSVPISWAVSCAAPSPVHSRRQCTEADGGLRDLIWTFEIWHSRYGRSALVRIRLVR